MCDLPPSAQFNSTRAHPLATLAGMKDNDLRIRRHRNLRDRLECVWQAQDKPAAQVLREFMRTYVDEYKELLADDPATNPEPIAKSG